MKIALIGPGMMEIPPQGWGAIEIIIWELSVRLKNLGHEVVIYNSRNLHEVSSSINMGNFDFVYLEYDEYIDHFIKHLENPFCVTSHYGYILQRRKWSRGYTSIFFGFLRAPAIIALSKEIKDLYINNKYKGPIYILRNGASISNFSFQEKGNGRALVLGKIEQRKLQAYLAKVLDGKVDIDFIGPIADKNFQEGRTTNYCGSWTKDEVYKKLTEYSTLVLLSEGEAAPMVVPEALAAGLSVVVSVEASANLDKTLPFVKIVGVNEAPEMLSNVINKSIKTNNYYRKQIREYAEKYFDYDSITQDLQVIIQKVNREYISVRPPSYTFDYLMSLFWRKVVYFYHKIFKK
jgi:hypothetical protein